MAEQSTSDPEFHELSSPSDISELTQSLQLGIQYSISKITPKPTRDLLITDFLVTDAINFPRNGTEKTPAHHHREFRFRNYAPVAFRHIRDHFDIQPESFLISLCSYPLKPIQNPGASGSAFFLSQDDNYIIKTVSQQEARFLLHILNGYWLNLNQNKKTLLPKFFGLFSYHSLNKNYRIIIMNNLLPSGIDYYMKFDLKGSTQGREANQRELNKEKPTYKDLDFNKLLGKGIVLPNEKYHLLTKSFERDCAVLESFEVMDYSLLVAIHNVTKALKRGGERIRRRNHSVLRNAIALDNASLDCSFAMYKYEMNDDEIQNYLKLIPEGSFLGKTEDGDMVVLFLGIIDILQNFRAVKKVEHALKSIIHSPSTVSVHNPNFYSKRFQKFMTSQVFIPQDPSKSIITTPPDFLDPLQKYFETSRKIFNTHDSDDDEDNNFGLNERINSNFFSKYGCPTSPNNFVRQGSENSNKFQIEILSSDEPDYVEDFNSTSHENSNNNNANNNNNNNIIISEMNQQDIDPTRHSVLNPISVTLSQKPNDS